MIEWIEVEHRDLRALRRVKAEELRAEVQALIRDGKAAVIECQAAPARSGQPTKIAGLEREFIYATEYDPPEIDDEGKLISPAQPGAFETRNLGFFSEFLPLFQPNGSGLRVELIAEWVQLRGMRTWGSGPVEAAAPDFGSIRSQVEFYLLFGKSRLVSTHRLPKPVSLDREDPRILVFAKAEAGERYGAANVEASLDEPPKPAVQITFEILETTQNELNRLLQARDVSMRGLELYTAIETTALPVETGIIASVDPAKPSLSRCIEELIYPSEYDPPESVGKNGDFTPPNPAAYETRNLGLEIRASATVSPDRWISLSFDSEVTSLKGMIESGKGIAKTEMPEFRTQTLITSIPCNPGEPTLLGTTRPSGEGDRIWVWFATVDVVGAE